MDNFRETANKTLNTIFEMVENDYNDLDVDFDEENLKIENEEKFLY